MTLLKKNHDFLLLPICDGHITNCVRRFKFFVPSLELLLKCMVIFFPSRSTLPTSIFVMYTRQDSQACMGLVDSESLPYIHTLFLHGTTVRDHMTSFHRVESIGDQPLEGNTEVVYLPSEFRAFGSTFLVSEGSCGNT